MTVRASAQVTINQAEVRRLVSGPTGPGYRVVTQAVRAVEAQAKRNAPVDTGRLRASITGSVQARGVTVVGRVGSNVDYAAAVHEGRRAITIRPRRARVLAWKQGGRSRFAAFVMQPAQEGNPFLTRALQQQAPRYGFRVSTTRTKT